MALDHTLQTEMPSSLTLSLDQPNSLFVFLTAEKLSKLAGGEKAATEELLVLLEEAIWNSIQQQEIKRFVSCNPSLLSSKFYCLNVCLPSLYQFLRCFHQPPDHIFLSLQHTADTP